MDLPTTDTSLETLEEVESPSMVRFTAEFVSKGGSGITRCLNNDAKPFSIKSGEPYSINFREPAFVSKVEIRFTKPVLGAEIELSAFESLSNKSIIKKSAQASLSDVVSFELNCVTTGVMIHLPRNFLELFQRRTLDISQIKISGYTEKDFDGISETLRRIDGLKEGSIAEIEGKRNSLTTATQKIQEREAAVTRLEATKTAQLEELTNSIDEATTEAAAAKQALESLTKEVTQAETRREAVREQISTSEASHRAIEKEISKGKEQLHALATETSEAERKLHGLLNNVNLFSEEFSSFADHGARQARVFIFLSIIPLSIIFLLTIQLLSGAADLSVKYTREPNIDLLTVFATRLPYLAVCGSILAVSYSALKFLLIRISTIYAERLDFSKIGIVAKEVSTASADGLSLTNDQLMDARTYLKIEMLKSYLSGSIGTFSYPKASESIKDKIKNGQRALPAQVPKISRTGASQDEEAAES